MTSATAFLGDLHEKRRKYVEGVELNGFEEGILSFLSDLYPDQAHFIYELLQNAEDAGATRIRFHLEPNQLRVVHNGVRSFDRKDVNSITSIGLSTKKEDINQIGKFGVGFKAVLSYSASPRIFSGDFNFRIDDLVCPTEIDAIEREPEETVFILPLGTSRKSVRECFMEIRDALDKLDHASVLFLNSIRAIEWKTEERRLESISREDGLEGISVITKSDETPVHFLRYQKQLNEQSKLRCGIALKLSFRSEKQNQLVQDRPLSEQVRFDPIAGKLCIFFPAEKENTGLKFHVNGPYASTIDRASIPHENKDNRRIIDETAKLLCDSMIDIKARGLLLLDFLEVLPNLQDELPPFYQTFRTRALSAMQKGDLVPTKERQHGRSTELLRGPKTVTDVLSGEDLQVLTKNRTAWAASGLQNARAEKFLDALDIPEWTFADLIGVLDKTLHWILSKSEAWLATKNDAWMQQFYLLLLTAAKRTDQEYQLPRWAVLLTTAGEYLSGSQYAVYFPSEGNPTANQFNILKPELLANVTREVRERLLEFLTAAGVSELGEQEEIQVILDTFYGENESPELTERQHLRHVRRFIRWFQENKEPSLFSNRRLFWDQRKKLLHVPSDCYLDRPFKTTNLSSLYDLDRNGTGSAVALWKGYVAVKEFISFAEAVGVIHSLAVTEVSTRNHPMQQELWAGSWRWSSAVIDQDYTIEYLDHIFSRKDPALTRLLWRTMCAADADILLAKFRPNRRFDARVEPSSLVLSLRAVRWIPSKDGTLHTPAEMTRSKLPKTFEFDDGNGWLTAVEFAANERKLSEESQRKLKFAKELGVSLEDLEFMNELKRNPDFYSRFRNELKTLKAAATFPQRPVHDETRRKEKVRKKLDAAPAKQYEDRTRSVRISKSEIDAQTWLREQYRNEEDEIICQLCSQVMPFIKRNGDYYFEAVALSSIITKEIEAAFLALCPLCAAKYMEFVRRNALADKCVVKDLLSSAEPEIRIDLSSEQGKLRFVESHWNDLKTILEELKLAEAHGV